MAGFSDQLFGTQDTFKQLPTLSAQQLGTQSQLGQNVSPLLQNLMGNKFDFAPIAQQARTRFQTQTVPSIAERFSSLGGQGGQRSSAFQGALGSAGAGLDENLASLQQQYGLQQQGQQQNLLSLLLGHAQQPGFENLFMQGRQGLLGSLAGGLGQGLGMTPALLAGGGGGGLMSILGSLFGGGGQQSQPQQGGYALSGGFGNQNFSQRFGQGNY
jgi:hypothetical protein